MPQKSETPHNGGASRNSLVRFRDFPSPSTFEEQALPVLIARHLGVLFHASWDEKESGR